MNIGDLAGGANGYINTWMAIGLLSHFYIRKYHAGWFRKYNVSESTAYAIEDWFVSKNVRVSISSVLQSMEGRKYLCSFSR